MQDPKKNFKNELIYFHHFLTQDVCKKRMGELCKTENPCLSVRLTFKYKQSVKYFQNYPRHHIEFHSHGDYIQTNDSRNGEIKIFRSDHFMYCHSSW